MDRRDSRPDDVSASLRQRVTKALAIVGVAPGDCLAIIEKALADAGSFNPRSPAQFALFVGGPLFQAVKQSLSEHAAMEIQALLDPVLTEAEVEESGVHRLEEEQQTGASIVLGSGQRAAREAFSKAFARAGYRVVTANHAAAIVEQYRALRPQVVVADLDWLDAAGDEIAMMVRAEGGTPGLVMMTQDAALQVESAVVLRKPVMTDQAVAAVAALLEQHASDAQLPCGLDDNWTYEESTDDDGAIYEEDTLDDSDAGLAHVVYETLSSVASPRVCDALIEKALWCAGLSAIPTEPHDLAAFVAGPLCDTVARKLGDDIAGQVAQQLDPIIEHALQGSGVTGKDRSPGESGPRPTVLLVDDDPTVLSTLERLLNQREMDVVVARDGHVALTHCTKQIPAVVVADLHMPAVSGMQLAALLQLTLGEKAPPLVILTGDHDAPPGMDWVSHVLHKPVDVAELVDVIRTAARRGAAGPLDEQRARSSNGDD